MNCLFCKIIDKTIPANIIYDTTSLLAFTDINPQAPHHLLIIPKQHLACLNDITTASKDIIGDMYLAAIELAHKFKFAEHGYRTVFNCNADGGQEVYHLHLHVMAGRRFHWPPG